MRYSRHATIAPQVSGCLISDVDTSWKLARRLVWRPSRRLCEATVQRHSNDDHPHQGSKNSDRSKRNEKEYARAWSEGACVSVTPKTWQSKLYSWWLGGLGKFTDIDATEIRAWAPGFAGPALFLLSDARCVVLPCVLRMRLPGETKAKGET